MNSRYLKNIILLVFSMLFVVGCARKPLPDIVGKTDKCEPKWFDSKTSEYGRDYYAYGVYSHPLRMQARMMAEGSGRMALAAELKTQIKAKFGESMGGMSEISKEVKRELAANFESGFGFSIDVESRGFLVSNFEDCNDDGEWHAYAEIKFNLDDWGDENWGALYNDAIDKLNIDENTKQRLQNRTDDILNSLD